MGHPRFEVRPAFIVHDKAPAFSITELKDDGFVIAWKSCTDECGIYGKIYREN